MERAGALPLLPAFRDRLGWEFVVPEGVLAELAVKHVPTELEAFLEDETARVGRRGARRAPEAMNLLAGLGRGGAEAMRTVDGRGDRTFGRYAVLTVGRGARARAGALGTGMLDALEFLPEVNCEGLSTADGAAATPGPLEASGCRPWDGGHGRFMRSLR